MSRLRTDDITSVLGIDPGGTGTAVLVTREGSVREIRFSQNPFSLADEFSALAIEHRPFVLIEYTHGRRDDDVGTAYTFGRNAGRVEGFLLTHGMRWDFISPTNWKKRFKLLGYSSETGKSMARGIAKAMYPDVRPTPTLLSGDAYLIATLAKEIAFDGLYYETLSDSVLDDKHLYSSARSVVSKHGRNARAKTRNRKARDT